jgi:hypothetical protein
VRDRDVEVLDQLRQRAHAHPTRIHSSPPVGPIRPRGALTPRSAAWPARGPP